MRQTASNFVMKPTMFHNVSLLTKCNLCLVSVAYCRQRCSTAALQHCRPGLGKTAGDRLAAGVWCGALGPAARRVQSRYYGQQRSFAICRYLHRFILLRLRRYLDIFILPLLRRCPEILRWYAVDRRQEGGAANTDRGVAQGVDPSHFLRIFRIIHVLQQDLQIYVRISLHLYLSTRKTPRNKKVHEKGLWWRHHGNSDLLGKTENSSNLYLYVPLYQQIIAIAFLTVKLRSKWR